MAYQIFHANTASATTGTYSVTGLNNPVNTVLSVNGSNYPSWSTAATQSTLKVQGDTEIDGNLKVNGKDLVKMLETIESRLAILEPNPRLESEFDELKALGDAYREAEKKFIEQKRVFEILKKQD